MPPWSYVDDDNISTSDYWPVICPVETGEYATIQRIISSWSIDRTHVGTHEQSVE